VKARKALDSGEQDALRRLPAPAHPARDPAPIPLTAARGVASLLATVGRGSRVPDVLLGLQHTAGNAAVQRIVAASTGPVVQRIWPFDDEEETVEGGGEGGSEGAGPVPTDVEGGGEQFVEGGGETPGETPGEPGSEEEVSEETPEETFDRLVGEGANAAALAVVVRAYGFGGKNVASISYDPSLGMDGLTGGEPNERQRITIGPSAFSYYSYCASVIGHEMQHVSQRIDPSPMQSKAPREFLAYSWQVIENRDLLGKDDQRANALQAYLVYQAMAENDQFMQQGRFAEVQNLRRQLGPATPGEG
jgi:hypothetical protein